MKGDWNEKQTKFSGKNIRHDDLFFLLYFKAKTFKALKFTLESIFKRKNCTWNTSLTFQPTFFAMARNKSVISIFIIFLFQQKKAVQAEQKSQIFHFCINTLNVGENLEGWNKSIFLSFLLGFQIYRKKIEGNKIYHSSYFCVHGSKLKGVRAFWE